MISLKRRLIIGGGLGTGLVSSRMMEASAWPGNWFSTSAACPTPPTATPPPGNAYATTGFSGSTAPLGAGDTVTLNSLLSPDNTVDAVKFTEGTANAQHCMSVSGAAISGSFSGAADVIVCLKQGSGTRNVQIVLFSPSFGNNTLCVVNPATGAIVEAAESNWTGGATPYVTPGLPTSNGFWMFLLHTPVINPGQTSLIWNLCSNNGTTESYTGDGTSSWYAWGGAIYSP